LFSALLARPSLLVDPALLVLLIRHNLLLLEPQVNLLFRALNAVRAVTDVATDIDGIVTADGTRGRCKRVGGPEDHCSSVNHGSKSREDVAWLILRPTLQASRPSQTMAQIGPLSMSVV
jgi:hypothetical protein